MTKNKPTIVFFGGEPLGVPVLEELKVSNIVPDLIVCSPDRPSGRGQKLAQPPVKTWALQNDIEAFQPESYKDKTSLSQLTKEPWDLFVVVAYNFILPEWLLEIPTHGVLNIHPSLLPHLRGPSPIRTAILDDLKDQVGVTVMLMDDKMDHGPILQQLPMQIDPKNWPLSGPDLDLALARMGGAMLAEVIPKWLESKIKPVEQDHQNASYTKKFSKEDLEFKIDPFELPTGNAARRALCKIQAFAGIGDTFFIYKDNRVKIKKAELSPEGKLSLLRVIPSGKKEMDFNVYLQSLR